MIIQLNELIEWIKQDLVLTQVTKFNNQNKMKNQIRQVFFSYFRQQKKHHCIYNNNENTSNMVITAIAPKNSYNYSMQHE